MVDAIDTQFEVIKAPENKLASDGVLSIVRESLEALGFEVESGKRANEKIKRV